MKKVFTLILAILFAFNSVAYAGVTATPGGSSSAGGTSSGGYGIDIAAGCKLNWSYFTGNVTLNCALSGFSRSLAVSSGKGAYVTIPQRSNTSITTWCDWRWFAKYVKSFPGDFNSSPWVSNLGRLADADLVTEASNSGYSHDATKEIYVGPSDYLNGVWTVPAWQQSYTETQNTLVSASIGSTALMGDRSGESAQNLFDNPTSSVPYSGTSGSTEMTHSRTISASYMPITRTVTYWTDGSTNWGWVASGWTKGSKVNFSRSLNYTVTQPPTPQKYFRPFDLNTKTAAITADVQTTYPDYVVSLPLRIIVDNKQGIADGSPIKTLDTNTSTWFNVKVLNDQFGIPPESSGGIDLEDSIPGSAYKLGDGTYGTGVIIGIGSGGATVTGKFSTDGVSPYDVSGSMSKASYWGGALKGGISSSKASLTSGGTEKIGGETFSFAPGWYGANFYFKTTSMGNYKLSNSGRPWWEIQYEAGKFYTYGVSYSGTVNIGSITEPTINSKNFYAGLASKMLNQPFMCGEFVAKTVGGGID